MLRLRGSLAVASYLLFAAFGSAAENAPNQAEEPPAGQSKPWRVEGKPQTIEVLPTPAPEIRPALQPVPEDWGHAHATRTVSVNLSVDVSRAAEAMQLKTKGGAVLAEAVAVPEDKLEFEVLITSPCGAIPVYFAVPADSTLYSVYRRYRDKDPAKILTFMDTIHPPLVRVVALRRERLVPFYARGQLRNRLVKEPWQAFYEVCLPDADCPEPVLTPVFEDDDCIHDLMYRTVAHLDRPQDMVLIKNLSGKVCGRCCSICSRSLGPCGAHHCASKECYCQGKIGVGPGPAVSRWGSQAYASRYPTGVHGTGILPPSGGVPPRGCNGGAALVHLYGQRAPAGRIIQPLRIVCNGGCLPGDCHCLDPAPRSDVPHQHDEVRDPTPE